MQVRTEQEEKVKTEVKYSGLLMVFLFSLFMFSCEEDRDICKENCQMKEDCAWESDTMFSYSRCLRDCRDQMEQYESIRCGEDYWDFLDCQLELRCSELDEVGEECAGDIDRLNECVD